MATATAPSPQLPEADSTQLLIVEAAGGNARRLWLEHRLSEMTSPGAHTWMVSCDFNLGGPWAGAKELFETLFPAIREKRPDLVEKHSLELVYVLPQLRRSITLRHPTLTDLAPRDERSRNYAADRAFRIVHGLIDLLDSWKRSNDAQAPWIIGCDSYCQAGVIGARFFSELMRRRGEELNIRLLIGVEPGRAGAVRASFASSVFSKVVAVHVPQEPMTVLAPDLAAHLATELEERVGDDLIERQIALPELIRLWTQAGRPDKLAPCKFFGLDVYNTLGLCSDALRYGEGLAAMAAEHAGEEKRLRWRIILKLLNCYSAMEDAQAGLRLAEGEAAAFVENERPLRRGQLCYLTAMFYARYSKPRNLVKGEEYLDRGLALIEQDKDLPEPDRHFHSVFNRNGVAMIRSFQGRHQEAIEFCRTGIARLNAHLGTERHRLHRSVLVYNIAQVYVATGSYDEAIQHYSAAMEMDPNYSEYYNERGNIFMRLGRLKEARADYLQAIELSPPYFEVFTNLGQCCRGMGAMDEAITAYTRALDLEPHQLLALLGRAKAHEETGHMEEAIADYTAALIRDPAQWEAMASRGIAHYETGNLAAALADFDRSIELKPEEADLYQNRAIVLGDMGRHREAARDLEAALRFNLQVDDRENVQTPLQEEVKEGLLSIQHSM
ncbi:MAG TPA: tetratricopeptide repeat protein [Candidatus Angelobacter sp.]